MVEDHPLKCDYEMTNSPKNIRQCNQQLILLFFLTILLCYSNTTYTTMLMIKMETKTKKKITLTHYHYNVYTLYIALLPCFNYYNSSLQKQKRESWPYWKGCNKIHYYKWQIWGGVGGKGTACTCTPLYNILTLQTQFP